jgi:hypothetical protein
VAHASPGVGREYYPKNSVDNQASPSCHLEGLLRVYRDAPEQPKMYTVSLSEKQLRTTKPLAFGE